MQIDRIFFPVTTLGYGKRIGIWTIGCPRRCRGCSNPELQASDPTKNIPVSDILIPAKKYFSSANGVTITGGEPFFQPEELCELVNELRKTGYTDILIYTGFTIDELRQRGGVYTDILSLTGVLIDGEYIDSLNDGVGIRGSSNQKIHILDRSLSERYCGAENCQRSSLIVNSGGRVMTIGIPDSSSVK